MLGAWRVGQPGAPRPAASYSFLAEGGCGGVFLPEAVLLPGVMLLVWLAGALAPF